MYQQINYSIQIIIYIHILFGSLFFNIRGPSGCKTSKTNYHAYDETVIRKNIGILTVTLMHLYLIVTRNNTCSGKYIPIITRHKCYRFTLKSSASLHTGKSFRKEINPSIERVASTRPSASSTVVFFTFPL